MLSRNDGKFKVKSHGVGKYGRLLGEIFIEGEEKSLNELLIENGHNTNMMVVRKRYSMDKIVIYSTRLVFRLCIAKRFLEEKNIPYEEINIDSQGISRNRLMELTGRLKIPTIVVNEKVIADIRS